MHPSATDSFAKGIASALATRPATATAASFDLAKLIAPAAGTRTVLDQFHESERRRAKLFALTDSPLLRATRELAALPRMGDAFAASLAVRSEALAGIGETMRKLMDGIHCHAPHIGATVVEMQARTAAITKALEGFRLPPINLSPSVMDAFTKGLAAPKFTEGLRMARLALDFPKLTTGFHQFLHESQVAQEKLVEPLVAIPPRELFLAGDAGLAFELVEPPRRKLRPSAKPCAPRLTTIFIPPWKSFSCVLSRAWSSCGVGLARLLSPAEAIAHVMSSLRCASFAAKC